MAAKRPNSCTNLNKALLRLAGSDEKFIDIRATMANVIVAQMIPDGVVKGGSQMKLRFGPMSSRVTMDLDTARSCDLDSFIKRFRAALTSGWYDFTADVIVKAQASPKGIPFEYVMQPMDVKLKYRGQPWPPKVEKGEGWGALYVNAKGALPVLPTVDEAIVWANKLIAKIDAA